LLLFENSIFLRQSLGIILKNPEIGWFQNGLHPVEKSAAFLRTSAEQDHFFWSECQRKEGENIIGNLIVC